MTTSDEILPVYTPATLSKRWQCSERHVRNMIEHGELPAFRLGGKLMRIRGDEVLKIELQGTAEALLDVPLGAIEQPVIPTKRPRAIRLDLK